MIKAKVLVFAILVYPISLWSVCAGYWVCVAAYYGYKIGRSCLGLAIRGFYFHSFFISAYSFLFASYVRVWVGLGEVTLRADQVVIVVVLVGRF